MKKSFSLAIVALALVFTSAVRVHAQQKPATVKKPNLLIRWGDDIGVTEISVCSAGLMGFETPKIDRIRARGRALSVP